MVGAHPALGELIAQEVLKLGLLQDALTLSNGFEQLLEFQSAHCSSRLYLWAPPLLFRIRFLTLIPVVLHYHLDCFGTICG